MQKEPAGETQALPGKTIYMNHMTPKQIRLIRQSFELMRPEADAVARTFYNRLFQLAPALRKMFPESLEEQGRKLMQMIGTAIELLGRADQLTPAWQALGRRHAGYGAEDEDYEIVGTALLLTFEQELGPAFTPDVREAWTQLYVILATTMRGAATPQLAASAEPL
jgi:hemoglobin-like flavoprotein